MFLVTKWPSPPASPRQTGPPPWACCGEGSARQCLVTGSGLVWDVGLNASDLQAGPPSTLKAETGVSPSLVSVAQSGVWLQGQGLCLPRFPSSPHASASSLVELTGNGCSPAPQGPGQAPGSHRRHTLVSHGPALLFWLGSVSSAPDFGPLDVSGPQVGSEQAYARLHNQDCPWPSSPQPLVEPPRPDGAAVPW